MLAGASGSRTQSVQYEYWCHSLAHYLEHHCKGIAHVRCSRDTQILSERNFIITGMRPIDTVAVAEESVQHPKCDLSAPADSLSVDGESSTSATVEQDIPMRKPQIGSLKPLRTEEPYTAIVFILLCVLRFNVRESESQ